MKSFLFPESSKDNNKELDTISLLNHIYRASSDEWERIKVRTMIARFKAAYTKVPAYKTFLEGLTKKKVSVKNIQEFKKLPFTSKKNYLRKYSWDSLCDKRMLTSSSVVMTATSGSTGDPFYFPRTSSLDIQTSLYYQMFLRSSGVTHKKTTLVIDSFGMGVWIGGLITYQAFKHISERGHPLTIITPGINKQEIFKAFTNLGKNFDQIILCGYPPFIKDVIDQAKDHGINLASFNIRVIFAAESFSEAFRDYVIQKVGGKDPYRTTMSIYGTADLGTMAFETPLCILLRRLALSNQVFYEKVFGQVTRLPTLAQYLPDYISFESENGALYGTGGTVLPLVRYDMGDNGGVLSYDQLLVLCSQSGIDLVQEIKKAKIEDTLSQLPFVYVYERSDFSTKLYGAIIYPEYIKRGIQKNEFQKYITGKFTMFTKFDENHDEYLEINLELQPDIKSSTTLKKLITTAITKVLIQESSEHRNNMSLLVRSKVEPRIVFWSYEHEIYFKPGGKQKWVKKLV